MNCLFYERPSWTHRRLPHFHGSPSSYTYGMRDARRSDRPHATGSPHAPLKLFIYLADFPVVFFAG